MKREGGQMRITDEQASAQPGSRSSGEDSKNQTRDDSNRVMVQ